MRESISYKSTSANKWKRNNRIEYYHLATSNALMDLGTSTSSSYLQKKKQQHYMLCEYSTIYSHIKRTEQDLWPNSGSSCQICRKLRRWRNELKCTMSEQSEKAKLWEILFYSQTIQIFPQTKWLRKRQDWSGNQRIKNFERHIQFLKKWALLHYSV